MLTKIFTCDRCRQQQAIERTADVPAGWTKLHMAAAEGGQELYFCRACSTALADLFASVGIIPPSLG